MRYTVLWTRDAENELITLWLDEAQREGLTEAAHAIDQALANDPEQVGESRAEGRRVMFEPPLLAIFRVYPEDCIVRVLHVKRRRPRRSTN